MKDLYQGPINRLILVAAPSCAGKTTLLKNSRKVLSSDVPLPKEISDFHDVSKSPIPIMWLARQADLSCETLCLHVDIMQPIRWLAFQPENRQQLVSSISHDLFSQWSELCAYAEMAKTLDIITLYVDRQRHFQRWLKRQILSDLNRRFDSKVLAVLGDDTNSSELHRLLYIAWGEFIQTLNTNSTHVLDANEKRHKFVSSAWLTKQLNPG